MNCSNKKNIVERVFCFFCSDGERQGRKSMTTPEDSLSRDSQKHGRNAIQRHKRGQWESDIDVLGSHLRHTEVQWGGENKTHNE
mgnify:CR=1 FL=1